MRIHFNEENVWKLCEQVKKTRPAELSKCYAVFVSNEGRTVPLWRQKAGRGDDKVVIWDYHVFFMHNPTPTRCLIFDLDTTLPFPTYFHKYVTETFRSDLALRPEHHRFFRVIPAEQYLAEFSSDRRHMRRPDGTWIKPPPPYPPIQSSATNTHNLDDFICTQSGKGPGIVYSLSQFVYTFFKLPNAQLNNTQN
ncbi:protein N-terminal glutamine amidohydrolase isoform X2 [Sitodiplosis mosellana]|uniref:protein N-terminal glutamine amidohydrolase isoform X2 n=1 Tax=Sitodiplosis mosellana TaxID=263140 RepID=UPI002444A667|nr:protein N-terminal glutamine amidohydrolase isoform X2 [Sitodiplosis mosellana]